MILIKTMSLLDVSSLTNAEREPPNTVSFSDNSITPFDVTMPTPVHPPELGLARHIDDEYELAFVQSSDDTLQHDGASKDGLGHDTSPVRELDTPKRSRQVSGTHDGVFSNLAAKPEIMVLPKDHADTPPVPNP